MADNDYRSYRSRDPVARDNGDQPLRDNASDPLAELARLIGQSDPYSEGQHRDRYSAAGSGEEAAPQLDWAADDGYAEEQPQTRADERYIQPPADSAQSYAPSPRGYDSEPPPRDARFFSGPAARFNGFRENDADREDAGDRDYQSAADTHYEDEQYRDEPASLAPGRQQPAYTPVVGDEHNERYAAEPYEDEHDREYGADDYYQEPPRRRGGFVVVMAVLGLAVLGTAGAFGYRAMFGASVLPTLPPIIKAGSGPNKIMPNYGDATANSSTPANTASSGSTEKLVSREEQPVDIQQQQPAAPSTAPRVVSTIPISPGTNQGVPAGMTAPTPPAMPAAPSGASTWPSAPAAPAAAMAAPAGPPPAMAAPVPPATPAPAPATVSSEPKKVHTLTIRTNQPAADGAAPALPPAPRSATRMASSTPKPSAAQSAPPSGNQPLSLVPAAQDDGAPLPPPPAPTRTRAPVTRTAVASAAPAPANAAATSSGGYAVQVTSQRSEAEAQAAFRELRNKFPNQLAGKEPIVRRADLGAKGVYYRALVGPFASMEAAAGMCSSLKAAGGTCLVQRN